jgi:hypothetical protein
MAFINGVADYRYHAMSVNGDYSYRKWHVAWHLA